MLIVGSGLLDFDEVSVARTAIPHASRVDLRSLAPTKGESATPVRRPRAIIVTDDGLGFAVTECDVVGGGHSGIPLRSRRGLNPAHGTMRLQLWALLMIHFGRSEAPPKR